MLTGWNSADQTTNYADIQGHGTKVAGTIAATTNNGTGIAAVAYRAKILPIRVTNDATGYAFWSDIARGLTWAADHGARVANISYDVTSSSAITSSANYMIGKGGLVTVSAGNGGAVTNGSHIIKAIAFDSAGNQGTAQVTVNVNNVIVVDTVSPSVTITSPSNGATIRSNTQFKIVASDDIAVKQIACYFDNTLVGSSTGLSSMTCNVNTRKYAVDPHTFKTADLNAPLSLAVYVHAVYP